MTKPAILDDIDAALEQVSPDKVRAVAEGRILSDVQDALGGPMMRRVVYKGVIISRSLAQMADPGYCVRLAE